MSNSNLWITRFNPSTKCRLRLFCFAYAGGGASVFRTWFKSLPPDIEVCAIRLPGRENRINELPFRQIPALIAALTPVVMPYLAQQPFAFFGHSLGALVSFELACALCAQHNLLPTRLLVSACHAPQLPRLEDPLHQLSDAEFIAGLRRLNGIPDVVLQNEDLLRLVIPALRADFTMFENYTYREGAPLPCPISAFGGFGDKDLPREVIDAWREQTEASFTLRMLPGDHFFMHSAQRLLLRFIVQDLA